MWIVLKKIYFINRRTEELINGVYGQYLYEQQIYGPNPAAPPHIPFSKDPSTSLQQTQSEHTNANIQNINIQSRLASYLTSPENSTENLPTFNDLESQVDSGHPSLDQSNSPPNEHVDTISNHDIVTADERKYSAESLKNNPFVINGVRRPPNKVILEPLDHNASSTVPKHLFAAKKLAQ